MNPARIRILTHVVFGHLPKELQQVSQPCGALAHTMAEVLDRNDPIAGAEVTTGLRKLLEAKDGFVRAQVILTRRAQQGAAG